MFHKKKYTIIILPYSTTARFPVCELIRVHSRERMKSYGPLWGLGRGGGGRAVELLISFPVIGAIQKRPNYAVVGLAAVWRPICPL